MRYRDQLGNIHARAPRPDPERTFVWMAPADQGLFYGVALIVGAGHVFGLSLRRMEAAGPDVVR
jgi:hypothetical protein